MGADPNFAAVVRAAVGQVSAANTARDGTGTIVTVLTAGSSGSKLNRVVVVAAGTVTAGVVRLFLHDGTNGRLFKEIIVPATTPGTGTETFRYELAFDDVDLPTGWSLRASTHNAETFNVFAFASDF